jgi:hypothetical protein
VEECFSIERRKDFWVQLIIVSQRRLKNVVALSLFFSPLLFCLRQSGSSSSSSFAADIGVV